MEQAPFYSQLNFSLPMSSAQRSGTGPSTALVATNAAVWANVDLPMFKCLSDVLRADPFTVAGSAHYGITNGRQSSYWFPDTNIMEDLGLTWRADTRALGPIMGINGGARMADIIDGTSNTMALCETPFRKNHALYGPFWNAWNYTSGVVFGQQINARNAPNCGGGGATGCPFAWGSGSKHVGGMQITMADGAVKFISENLDFAIFRNLTSIADGTVLGEF